MKKEPKISSLIDKACFDYNLIEDGDRILIGVSGGKDSTVLAEYFSNRAKRPFCGFTYKALNIQSDFAPDFPAEIKKLFKKWKVPFESLNVNISARVKEGQKMSCYWCSTQRRTELIRYAMEHGYNKIALGHHMDDILETLLMNALQKGEFSTMIPSLQYENYPIKIIRPLCYVTEDRIIKYADEQKFRQFTCTCDFQDNSTRKESKKKLKQLTGGKSEVKERLFTALQNIKMEYLP